MRSAACLILLLSATLAAGCGGTSTDTVPMSAVSGKITLNGSPLTDALVVFSSPERGAGSSATVDGEGRYTLPDKLPIGEYEVTVMPAPIPPPNPGEAAPPIPPTKVPPKYGTKAGGLTAKVVEGDNSFDFDLQP